MLATLGTAAVAAAAVTDGTYTQGNVKTGAAVRMVVKDGRFAIKVARLREHCRYGDRDFTEWIKFVEGSKAKLGGPVNEDGSFSGLYASSAGRFKASGLISGTSATIKVVESGAYNFASTTHPNQCKGSKTYQATLAGR